MDLHPILVHFPIALLTIYALFEICSFPRLLRLPYWWTLKAVFVILGSLTSMVAYFTGSLISKKDLGTLRPLVEMHSAFATGTALVFGMVALSYLFVLLKKENILDGVHARMAERLQKPHILIPLAMIGLLLVTITGALGGAIVYGPDADPIVSFIYHLLIQ